MIPLSIPFHMSVHTLVIPFKQEAHISSKNRPHYISFVLVLILSCFQWFTGGKPLEGTHPDKIRQHTIIIFSIPTWKIDWYSWGTIKSNLLALYAQFMVIKSGSSEGEVSPCTSGRHQRGKCICIDCKHIVKALRSFIPNSLFSLFPVKKYQCSWFLTCYLEVRDSPFSVGTYQVSMY